MVATNSTMQSLGTQANAFSLVNTNSDNQLVSLSDFSDQPVLIAFICNHCPYVVHLAQGFADLANHYQQLGVAVVAISSNDVDNYPQDGPDQMKLFAQRYAMQFPYCYDQSQVVAQDYGAACTPDFFVFDRNHQLFYRGQMDASRPNNDIPVTGDGLKFALDAVLAGQSPPAEQVASIGCNIKWRAGNEPSY